MSRDRDEFVAVITESYMLTHGNTAHIAAAVDAAKKLLRLGRESSTLAVRQCNEPLPDGYVEKRRESIRRRVQAVLDEIGFTGGFEVGGDPRGYTLKIILPSGRYNTFGGKEEGWGVPNS